MKDNNIFNTTPITKIRPTIEFFLGADTEHDKTIECGVLEKTLRTAKQLGFVDENGKSKVDRVFMYNPDAIGLWIYQEYKDLFKPLENITQAGLFWFNVYWNET